jgi:hypothetical protein
MANWQTTRNGKPRWPCDLVRLARHRGAPLGYRLHRSRKPKGPGNAGEFMLIHKASSTVVLGAGYAATIEAVLDFIEREWGLLRQARADLPRPAQR